MKKLTQPSSIELLDLRKELEDYIEKRADTVREHSLLLRIKENARDVQIVSKHGQRLHLFMGDLPCAIDYAKDLEITYGKPYTDLDYFGYKIICILSKSIDEVPKNESDAKFCRARACLLAEIVNAISNKQLHKAFGLNDRASILYMYYAFMSWADETGIINLTFNGSTKYNICIRKDAADIFKLISIEQTIY